MAISFQDIGVDAEESGHEDWPPLNDSQARGTPLDVSTRLLQPLPPLRIPGFYLMEVTGP